MFIVSGGPVGQCGPQLIASSILLDLSQKFQAAKSKGRIENAIYSLYHAQTEIQVAIKYMKFWEY